MGKIVVNKHFDVKSNITPESFAHKGEIIISNQVGFEGIFIKNNNGEIFYIAPTEGTGTDVPLEYKEYIESFINGRLEGYITREEFDELIKNVQIDPAQVRVIANEEITSALTVYSTTEEMNVAISEAVSKIVIPSTEGLASEEFVMEKIAEAKLEGDDVDLDIFVTKEELDEKGFLTEIPEQSIRDIAVETVSDSVSAFSAHVASVYATKIEAEEYATVAKEEAMSSASAYTDTKIKEVKNLIQNTGAYAHQPLTYDQYTELITNGTIEITDENGETNTIVYDDNTFYAIYE